MPFNVKHCKQHPYVFRIQPTSHFPQFLPKIEEYYSFGYFQLFILILYLICFILYRYDLLTILLDEDMNVLLLESL